MENAFVFVVVVCCLFVVASSCVFSLLSLCYSKFDWDFLVFLFFRGFCCLLVMFVVFLCYSMFVFCFIRFVVVMFCYLSSSRCLIVGC